MRKIGRIACILLAFSLLLPAAPAPAAAAKLSTLEEFAAQVEEHALKLDTKYTVPCTWSLADELKQLSSTGLGATLFTEILLQSGYALSCSVGFTDNKIVLDQISYYPGWRIAQLKAAGKTASLSEREKQVLSEAEDLVSGASGTDLEKERYFFDRLCERITYTSQEDESGEKDTAVGALLNGRADCDGYSDAMLLCCSLAGIPCRFLHSRALRSMQPGSEAGSHLCNLIFVKDAWLFCDVTWGDQESGPSYLFFNLGRRDASLAYHWNAATLFTEIAAEADFAAQLMLDQQPAVIHSLEDVYLAGREAALAKANRVLFYSPEEAFWQTDHDGFWQELHRCSFGSCSYNSCGRFLEITGLSYSDRNFSFCDTGEDILSAIESWTDQGIRSFRLYLKPSLAERLFADEHAALQELLRQSSVPLTGRYYYSTSIESLSFDSQSFGE